MTTPNQPQTKSKTPAGDRGKHNGGQTGQIDKLLYVNYTTPSPVLQDDAATEIIADALAYLDRYTQWIEAYCRRHDLEIPQTNLMSTKREARNGA